MLALAEFTNIDGVQATLGGLALAPSLTGWTLDNDDKMLRDIGLSTLLIQGLFLTCFAASAICSAFPPKS